MFEKVGTSSSSPELIETNQETPIGWQTLTWSLQTYIIKDFLKEPASER
jgi:hypothetical protein